MPRVTLVPLLVSPRGQAKPRNAERHVFWGLKEGQIWLGGQCEGRTFDLAAPVSITLPLTWAELQAKYGSDGKAYWRDAMAEFAARGLNFCDQPMKTYRLYYFRPFSVLTGLGGGTVGMENFGCQNVWPRTSCRADYKNLLMCGYTVAQVKALGWAVPWWDDGRNVKSVIGGDMHEFIHHVDEHAHLNQPNNAQGWPEITKGYPSFPNVYIGSPTREDLITGGYLA
jgi:hypothetical protein